MCLRYFIPTVLLFLGLGMDARAQAGTPDPSFDGDGLVSPVTYDPNGGFGDSGESLALQPDGKILLGGTSGNGTIAGLVVSRFNTDGSPDSTFSSDGKVFTPIGTSNQKGRSVALQPDGRILLGGHFWNGSDEDFVVVRYDADGALDSSFGTGGIVTTDLSPYYDEGVALALQPDGKILLGGSSYVGMIRAFALVRYNADGTLDPSFSTDGKVTTMVGTNLSYALSVALQPDGKVLMTGTAQSGSDCYLALVRYNPDGSLDASFSSDGQVTTDVGPSAEQGYSVALQPDAKILVSGSTVGASSMEFLLVRYNPDGSLDTTFSVDGFVSTEIAIWNDVGRSLALQPDGKVLVGGSSYDGTLESFVLVRYNSNGSLDTSFSSDGIVTNTFGGSGGVGRSVLLQPDGRILLGGSLCLGLSCDFAIVRYLNDLNIGMADFQLDIASALIFPNPIFDRVTFSYELNETSHLSLQLVDAVGRTARSFFNDALRVHGHQEDLLDLSGLASGQYTLVLSNSKGSTSVKVLKQ